MNGHVLGAVLLTASGCGWGLCSSAGLRRELREREELCRMLALATFQLTRFRTPLPELFALLAAQRSGRASALCAAASEGLSDGMGFGDAWTKACGMLLDRRERELLQPLGSVLGRYGAEEQAAAVESVRAGMEEQCRRARGELGEKCRMRLGLSGAAGVLLAVLLF